MDIKISEIDINQIIGVALGLCVIYLISIGFRFGKSAIIRILEAKRLLDWMIKFAEANGFKSADEVIVEDVPTVKQPAMLACEMIENTINAPQPPEDDSKRVTYDIKRIKKIQEFKKESANIARSNKIVRNDSKD